MIGRVCVHTFAKELIKEGLKIKVKNSIFNVNVIEEIRDVLEHCLQENNNTKKNEEQEDGRMNMDEDRNDDGNMKERNRKMEENGNESGDDEMADKNNLEEGSNGGDGSDFRKAAHGGRELHEDQESRISSEVKVKDTFEEENTNYEIKAALAIPMH
ncbi:hypothetical protein Tco_0397425 [Tanacetum coccineum]